MQVLAQPEVLKRFEEQGLSAGNMTPSQLGAFIRTELAKWNKVVKQAGVSPQ